MARVTSSSPGPGAPGWQVCVVMVITLLFRIPDELLRNSELIRALSLTADHRFYSAVLEVLLYSTLLPVFVVLANPSSAEKAQQAIFSLAKKKPEHLEQLAMTPVARERIRAAIRAVVHTRSVSNAFVEARTNAFAIPQWSSIFEHVDSRAQPAGTIQPGELIAWWATAEPPLTVTGTPIYLRATLGFRWCVMYWRRSRL